MSIRVRTRTAKFAGKSRADPRRWVRRASAYLKLAPVVAVLAACSCTRNTPPADPPPGTARSNLQQFAVTGAVQELLPQERSLVIQHEPIPNYMDAMTMSFLLDPAVPWPSLQPGDEISFRLSVDADRSWIDRITRTGRHVPLSTKPTAPESVTATSLPTRPPVLEYPFTNQLGQAMRLSDFHGHVLALTFFFTRCPIPDYCPRLSRNFAEASKQLATTPNAPTNWHFISVSIDPEFDSPAVLKAYAQRYGYDPTHWSFLTGPSEKIRELARQSGMHYEPGNVASHNFRTLVIDPTGRLCTTFPMGGNLSQPLVEAVLRCAKGAGGVLGNR